MNRFEEYIEVLNRLQYRDNLILVAEYRKLLLSSLYQFNINEVYVYSKQGRINYKCVEQLNDVLNSIKTTIAKSSFIEKKDYFFLDPDKLTTKKEIVSWQKNIVEVLEININSFTSNYIANQKHINNSIFLSDLYVELFTVSANVDFISLTKLLQSPQFKVIDSDLNFLGNGNILGFWTEILKDQNMINEYSWSKYARLYSKIFPGFNLTDKALRKEHWKTHKKGIALNQEIEILLSSD